MTHRTIQLGRGYLLQKERKRSLCDECGVLDWNGRWPVFAEAGININASRDGDVFAIVSPKLTHIDMGNCVVGTSFAKDHGVRKPMKHIDPKLPSQTEIDEQYLTHLPFRNWCKHCIRGKSRSANYRVEPRHDGMAEVHIDYCVMNTADSDQKHILVAVREKFTRMT